jgi:hypothetical protein
MFSPSLPIGVRGRGFAATAFAGVVAAGLMLPMLAWAQDAAPVQQPPHKPGIFESVGRFFDDSASNFRDSIRGAKRRWDELGSEAATNNQNIGDKADEARKTAAEATQNAAEATKNAVDAVAKLPTARMVEGREKCQVAPNGAPDCLSAAEALCRKQGYATGKSMDFTSAEECPARTLLGQASRDECTTTTFINREMCQ